MEAYLDNCVVSAMVRGDLADAAEMAAVATIKKAVDDGRLQLVTSRESWREQDRANDPTVRAMLKQARPEVPLVKDEKLLGMYTVDDQVGGFSTNPMVTEYVDDQLFEKLKNAGMAPADARHVMYAAHNKSDRFVTTDPHFLSRRQQLEALCPATKIVKPSELAAELNSDPKGGR
jgi:predicted nucleic acid-binding protein